MPSDFIKHQTHVVHMKFKIAILEQSIWLRLGFSTLKMNTQTEMISFLLRFL